MKMYLNAVLLREVLHHVPISQWSPSWRIFCYLTFLIPRTNRLLFLKAILEKWSGPISAALALTPAEYSSYSQSVKNVIPFSIPSRLTIVPFELDTRKAFPVNRLRNIAIKACNTTHFLYNDIDFMPSGKTFSPRITGIDNLYENLMRIPESFLNTNRQAIIVPAFEIYPKMKIDKRAFSSEWKRLKSLIPGNKSALATCMNSKHRDCIIFRDKAHLHVW